MFRLFLCLIFFVNLKTSLCHVQGNLRHFVGSQGKGHLNSGTGVVDVV